MMENLDAVNSSNLFQVFLATFLSISPKIGSSQLQSYKCVNNRNVWVWMGMLQKHFPTPKVSANCPDIYLEIFKDL